ncbi:MAG: hypothetical protein CFK52_01345 [Chloracidobacterium sp. CP2_5A]|nr:MAG: hypothetical protein CFK52_01345 [Chloracidobacterium sp. CP2_5A]
MRLKRLAVSGLLVAGLSAGGFPPQAAGGGRRPGDEQKLTVTPVKTVPPSLRGLLKGRFQQGFRWDDLNGDNWLLLTQTGAFPSPGRKRRTNAPEEFRQAELYACRFVNASGVFSKAWQIADFVRECPLDVTAEFIFPATEVTDLDGNGIAEAWVMYKTACRGDVSPATLKIIMYEGNQKYALRGSARIELPDFAEGGDKSPDAALRANQAFFQHAERKWKRFCKETFP